MGIDAEEQVEMKRFVEEGFLAHVAIPASLS